MFTTSTRRFHVLQLSLRGQLTVSSPNARICVQKPCSQRGEIEKGEKKKRDRERKREEVVRPIHQLPRLAAPRTYFLASPRRHVGGGVALCWFYEALKNGPRVRSSLSSPLRSPSFFPSHLVHAFGLFVESPLLDKVLCRLGPWWMPIAWAPAFQSAPMGLRPNPHGSDRLLPRRKDTRPAL